MIRQTRLVLSLLLPIMLASACAGSTEPAGRVPELEALPRALTPAERKVLDAGNDFSWTLLQRVSEQQRGKTVVISPISASMALGMTLNGAAGSTFDEMRSALRLGGASLEEIDEGYKASIALLRGLDNTVEFRLANSIFHEPRFPFHQSFLDAGKNYFDAEIQPLDFLSPGAPGTINAWVSKATNGRITSMVESTRDEVMYLLNAIYFKAKWRDPFDPARTRDAEFRAADGTRQPAKLMHREGTLRWFRNDQVEGAVLPYGNGAFAMTILLPAEGTSIDAFAESIDGVTWLAWQSQVRETGMDLYLPRFTIAYERTLNDDLAALGMGDAFSPSRANFSRMTSEGVYISIVKQKTWVQVDEEGTEAAAATSVGIRPVSLPPSMRVDRPFVFVIHERLSGTVLFVGKVSRL
jgi:serine protease inhibitor